MKKRNQHQLDAKDRLFIGIFPTGIGYADRAIEEHGDYRKLAFLPFATLEPELYPRIPPALLPQILTHIDEMQSKRGQQFQISTSGQTVTLGYEPKKF